jgi:hypothetical protein
MSQLWLQLIQVKLTQVLHKGYSSSFTNFKAAGGLYGC